MNGQHSLSMSIPSWIVCLTIIKASMGQWHRFRAIGDIDHSGPSLPEMRLVGPRDYGMICAH